jgi:hypothetical protein
MRAHWSGGRRHNCDGAVGLVGNNQGKSISRVGFQILTSNRLSNEQGRMNNL